MARVRRITFDGHAAVELTTRALRLVAITSAGPRIALLGRPRGGNLLYWAPRRHRRCAWDLMGGHRVWTTRPAADESEETYRPDNDRCSVAIERAGFTATAPPDAQTRIQRGLRARATRVDRIEVDHFAHNMGDLLWSGGLWGVTCTAPGFREPSRTSASYHVPLGDGSAWDQACVVIFNSWDGGRRGGGGFADEQFSFTRDQFVLRPSGRENKRMLRADAGILAMHDAARSLLFAKRAACDARGNYPLGTNVALYASPGAFMVEMETMGPLVTLKPGEGVHHVETWVLRPAARKPPSAAALRALFA